MTSTALLASGPYFVPTGRELLELVIFLLSSAFCFALFVYGAVQFFAKRRWEKGVILVVVSILGWLFSQLLVMWLIRSTSH